MKKLFTLVLALVMVFAIAAPAMAAWNGPDATVGAPYSIKVTAVQVQKDGYGNSYYTAFPANGAVVAGTPVLAMIQINIPIQDKLDVQYGKSNNATAFGLAFDYENLTFGEVVSTAWTHGTADKGVAPFAITEDGATITPSTDKADVYTIVVRCTVDETKAAKFEAVLGYDAAGEFTDYATDTDDNNKEIVTSASITIGSFAIVIDYENSEAVITYTKKNTELTLALDENGKVTGWSFNDGTHEYAIYNNGTVFTGTEGTHFSGNEDETYDTLAAGLKIFTDKFGFKVGDTVYFTEDNVLGTFGLSATISDSCEFKPYTSSLTVSDTAAVPNTGDSVSVIGFVMVGLALLATAAVVVKKVRA